uniref:DUF7495 domain-containing protein n=3 Tax=Odontella aurita TaxID=265563 RepID=A0A6U6L439_9STRA|mmetsp:Transcript_6617/g.19524  ORF Transcript_6617/g.19524 Transcript_6617/m.19524 type:complete len:446 (+) Transcript_6617:3-1340(+)
MSDDEEMEYFFYGTKDELPQCLAEPQARDNTLGNAGMVKYGTAVIDQKYHNPIWFGNPVEMYQETRDFCKSKGMDLCPLEKICPNGPNGTPDGGVRSGDHWTPYLDEDNGWVQIGTWINSADNTCKTHEYITLGSKPGWGIYPVSWPTHFNDLIMCCGVADQYAYDEYAGYYDVKGCGECHDECFWMGEPGATYNPSFEPGSNPWHTPIAYDTLGNVKGFFTCRLSGSRTSDKSTDLRWLKDDRDITTFSPRKCAGKGQPSPKYRADEYMGCYNSGYPSALPELVGGGQPLSFSKCSDACASRNYHYFGRSGNGQCRCGGRTKDDYTFQRFGPIRYGDSNYCECDSDNVGNGVCTYRVVDQFDPNTARKHHPCRYLPAYDMRKQCYIACRDANQSMSNQLTCKMLETMGMTYLSKTINKHNDEGGSQLHMLGGDAGGSGSNLGTF